MAILFLILKIIGIIVLVIVILLALVLFAPVTYRVEGDIDAKSAQARAAWLGGVLSLRFSYQDAETDFGIFICGIRAHKPKFIDRILEFIRKRRRKKARKKEEKDPDPEHLFETDEPGTKSGSRAHTVSESPAAAGQTSARCGSSDYTLPEDEIVVVKPEEHAGPDAPETSDFDEDAAADEPDVWDYDEDPDENSDEKFDSDFEPDGDSGIFGRITGRFGNGGFSFGRIIGFLKLFWEYKQKGLYGKIFQAVKKFLYRARPRRLSGRVSFGFEDPARTGQVLGVASLVPFVVNSELKVEPDFETEDTFLEGNADLRGRIHLVFAVVLAVRLFTNKDFRRFLHQLRHG